MCELVRALAGYVCAGLVAAAAVVGTASSVMAGVNFTLPVSQTVNVTDGKSADTSGVTVTYKLTAEDGAPLPNEAAGSECSFSIAGNAEVELAFTYDATGEYSYVLERTGIAGMTGAVVDGDPVKVRIVNEADEENFKVTPTIYVLEGTSDVGKKMTGCAFEYECTLANKTVTPTPTSAPTVKASSESGGSGASSGGSSTSTVSGVKTGDESRALLYLMVMVAAVVVLRGAARDGS